MKLAKNAALLVDIKTGIAKCRPEIGGQQMREGLSIYSGLSLCMEFIYD